MEAKKREEEERRAAEEEEQQRKAEEKRLARLRKKQERMQQEQLGAGLDDPRTGHRAHQHGGGRALTDDLDPFGQMGIAVGLRAGNGIVHRRRDDAPEVRLDGHARTCKRRQKDA